MADLIAALGEDEVVAPFEVNPAVELMIRAWCNEKSAPELLPFAFALINGEAGILSMLEGQQQALSGARRDVYSRGLYQLDIDRLKFVVAAYLRTRLGKVQRWYLHLQALPLGELDRLLSPPEREFLADYLRAREDLMGSAVLNQLPAAERTLDGGDEGGGGGGGSSSSAAAAAAAERAAQSEGAGSAESTLRDGPSLKVHVFFRAVEDFDDPNISLEPVSAGMGYLVSYSEIRGKVLDGSVELR